jgi:hypothetical protein
MKSLKLGKLKKAVKITDPLEMVGFIRTNKLNCQFVSMLTVTEPDLLKRSPLYAMYKDVKKVSRRNGMINVNFNKGVRKRIAEQLGVEISEVEYTNGTTWYNHQLTEDGKALPLCKHAKKEDGKHYLQYFPMRSTTKYLQPNGEEVPAAEMEKVMRKRTETDYKPAVVVFGMDSIKQLVCAGIQMDTDETNEVKAILA